MKPITIKIDPEFIHRFFGHNHWAVVAPNDRRLIEWHLAVSLINMVLTIVYGRSASYNGNSYQYYGAVHGAALHSRVAPSGVAIYTHEEFLSIFKENEEEEQFTKGEVVEVRDRSWDEWQKRLYYKADVTKNIRHLTVAKNDEDKFKSGGMIAAVPWNEVRKYTPPPIKRITMADIAEKFGVPIAQLEITGTTEQLLEATKHKC